MQIKRVACRHFKYSIFPRTFPSIIPSPSAHRHHSSLKSSSHILTPSITTQDYNTNLNSTSHLINMTGRGKGGKGLGKGGAKRHRKILRDNIQGITKVSHPYHHPFSPSAPPSTFLANACFSPLSAVLRAVVVSSVSRP